MSLKFNKSEELELEVASLAYGGKGVARVDGFVVFVEGAVPGDTVRAVVTRSRPSYAEARAVEILGASVSRVAPRCAHFGTCGGCSWQTLAYADQLAWKQQQVKDCLERIGGLAGYGSDEPLGAEPLWRYRNKVEFSFADNGDALALGFHLPGQWRQVLNIDDCLLHSEATNAIRNHIGEYAAATGLTTWDQRSGRGYWRHLVLREGANTGEIMVNLVTAPGALPDSENFSAELVRRFPDVVALLHSVNETQAATAAGHPFTVLAGRDHFFEELGGLKLKVPPSSFLQTNTRMAERLYRRALEYAGLDGSETVFDLYSGIGSIALLLAGSCREVWGVEIGEEAVAQARENAALNDARNASFSAGKVRSVLKAAAPSARPDVIVLDPPRAGASKKEMQRIIELGPDRIVYVSCNPSTLAGNAAQLVEGGYRLVRAGAVDMFPHTPHIEVVARFEKG
ncbi:MAG: 23S rRNA (uracil(1939)-C(5))-methyltransferase RlmD [Thermoleophilia bacterium]